MYLLDTNIISYWMRGDQGLIERIRKKVQAIWLCRLLQLQKSTMGLKNLPTKKNTPWKNRTDLFSAWNLSIRWIGWARIWRHQGASWKTRNGHQWTGNADCRHCISQPTMCCHSQHKRVQPNRETDCRGLVRPRIDKRLSVRAHN